MAQINALLLLRCQSSGITHEEQISESDMQQ